MSMGPRLGIMGNYFRRSWGRSWVCGGSLGALGGGGGGGGGRFNVICFLEERNKESKITRPMRRFLRLFMSWS